MKYRPAVGNRVEWDVSSVTASVSYCLMDYVDVFHVVDDAALFDAFDEGVASAVVGDC